MMPGKRWSRQEKKLLRRQINAGIPLADVVVPQRTTDGIVYQLRQLKLYPTSRWTRVEVSRLRKGSKAGKPPVEDQNFGALFVCCPKQDAPLKALETKTSPTEALRHELSEYSLADVHPSLSAIAAVSAPAVLGRVSPEKIQIEKSEVRPSQLIPRWLSTKERF